MKKIVMSLMAVVALTVFSFAFNGAREGSIQGRIIPAEGVKEVFAIVGADTMRSQLSNGTFVFRNLKRAVYTLTIKTNAPYRDASIQNVAVTDSAITDVGEVKLLQ